MVHEPIAINDPMDALRASFIGPVVVVVGLIISLLLVTQA
jgi:hypothetical protein